MTWEEKQEEIEETLRHYGISDEEIKGQSFGYYKTKDEPFKQMYGICELEKLHESKKLLIGILFEGSHIKLNSAIIACNQCQWQGLRRDKSPIDTDFVYDVNQSSRA